jgi:serine/threonine protein kinase
VIETRQILEELQLKNVLATSATGAVFLAGDPDTGADVVIKMVSCAVPGAEEKVRRLFLEMAAAARSAPIAAMPLLTDHGLTPEGDGFLVMELVEGRTLNTFDDIPAFAAVNILLDLLSCIEDLARVGTAHLNLTSNNILVTNTPADDRGLVLGFGTSATLLHAGAGVPVPAQDPHLAPELVAGNLLAADQRWRSDLFSFGVIACGVLGAEIEANGYDRPVVTLTEPLRSALPEAEPLEEILGRIMAPDPMLRGDSPSVVRDPLIRALPDPPARPGAAAAVAPVAPPTFDPNRTDPSFEVPTVEPPLPVVPALSASEVEREPVTEVIELGDDWPAVLFDDPELPASLDLSEDTDVSNPVPPDVWVPPATVEAVEAVGPTAGSTAVGGGRRVSRLELAVVAVVVVVLGSIIAFTWSTTGRGDRAPVVAGVADVPDRSGDETLVPPPPDANLFDDLLAIQGMVDAGDLVSARAALDGLDSRDDVAMTTDEAALHDSLVAAVAGESGRTAALADLRTGLAHGSIKLVRRGAAGRSGMSPLEIAAEDGLAGDLKRARQVIGLHTRMWEAYDAGDHLGAISASNELALVLPGYSGAREVRDQSAEAIEGRAEAFVAGRELDKALAVYESLLRVWPDRAGLSARVDRCREQLEIARREESVITAALAMGQAGDPEGGLARLDSIAGEAGLSDDVAAARATLEAKLAELDAGTPGVELATAVELSFKKNERLTIPFRATDDHRVESVVVHARNENDDTYLEIPLEADDEGLYRFTVTPELHGNTDVVFYVVALDRSGHVGRLGSSDQPLTIVRSKWFKKLL